MVAIRDQPDIYVRENRIDPEILPFSEEESADMSAYRAVDTCSMVFEGFEWTYALYERIED